MARWSGLRPEFTSEDANLRSRDTRAVAELAVNSEIPLYCSLAVSAGNSLKLVRQWTPKIVALVARPSCSPSCPFIAEPCLTSPISPDIVCDEKRADTACRLRCVWYSRWHGYIAAPAASSVCHRLMQLRRYGC